MKMQSIIVHSLLATMVLSPGNGPTQTRQPASGQFGQEEVLKIDECKIRLIKERIVTVGASQTGILEYVEPGELGMIVEANKKVAKIRDKVMQQKLIAARKRAESEVEIKYAEASLNVARQKYTEAKSKKGSYAQAEVMNLGLEYRKSQLQLEKAQFDAEIAKLEPIEIEAELENYIMTAPIGGEVSAVLKQTGESVRQGDDILEITDVSEVRAVGRIPVRYQPRITKGTRVRIYLVGTSSAEPPPFDNVFEGKITVIDQRISQVTQELEILATIRNQRDANGNFILREGIKTRMEVLIGDVARAPQRGAASGRSRAQR